MDDETSTGNVRRCGRTRSPHVSRRYVVATFGEVSVPDAWLPMLAALQFCAAAGLLLGFLGVPAIGIVAAVGLVLFYIGAVVTHLRAGAHRSIPSPALFLALAVATLVVTAIQ